MTRITAQCPSCGAPVEFASAASVQTTCRYCTSVLVRSDMELRDVGVKASVPPSVSPIKVGTRGVYEGRRFEVIGRLIYAYDRGRWNEWHILFDDESAGWLSDAQAEYAVTFPMFAVRLPPAGQAQPGVTLEVGGKTYTITTGTTASYAGTEGELPFQQWSPGQMRFADLRGPGGLFGTLDYSNATPRLYAGRFVTFDELRLSELREPEEVKAAARTVSCPNCSGSVTVTAADRTVNVVCQHCWSVLDARTPTFNVLQTFQSRLSHKPRIELGSTGTFQGEPWEAIGFQVRSIRVDGRDYAWDEYLLFSPRLGFRYLTEYDGHWNQGAPIQDVPRRTQGVRPRAELNGRSYRHFQRAQAETTFVLGEFPWEVRVGDKVTVSDYVSPPFMLSAEEMPDETTWTLSEYIPGEAVWKAFGMQGTPPFARGVYANQPSPVNQGVGKMWLTSLALVGLLLVMLMVRYSAGERMVASRGFTFEPLATQGQQQVIGPFVLDGRTSNLVIDVRATVDNSWADFDFSLADSTGKSTEFGKEVSYYSGVDGGESWSEGSRSSTVRIPSVPPGRYSLRVEPQGEQPFSYTVLVRRDVPAAWMYLVAALLLLLPPLLYSTRAGMFEASRWAESDYAPSSD